MAATCITFDVDSSLKIGTGRIPKNVSTKDHVASLDIVRNQNGRVLLATETPENIPPSPLNGLVGTALMAYNNHHHLVLRPDDIWIGITTSLAAYIDRNAEVMRSNFVNHDDKIELVAKGDGNILSANYADLVKQISDQIDSNTKDDIKTWLECNFSTSTDHTRMISKIVLMGAMKNYFDYKFELKCGLPKVTLKGNKEDWLSIFRRIDRLRHWKSKQLSDWADILEFVLQNFLDAFDGIIDTKFWNRIATTTGGGSFPVKIHGWILAFCPFDDKGRYCLNPLDKIKETNNFGSLKRNDVPPCAVEVPVKIDDNGRMYDTLLYAGALMTQYFPEQDGEPLCPSLEWALIDVTK